MTVRVNNQPDFASGLVFMAIGGGFVVAASRYEFGSAAQMGPAQFPIVVGGLLAVFGLVIALRSLSSPSRESIDRIALKPLLLVLGSVSLFGLLLQPLGLVLSSIALVVIAASASHEFRWGYVAATAVLLTLFCYLIFVVGLGLPMRVYPGEF